MLFVVSAETQKPKLSDSPPQNPLSSSSETHVFRSKLPDIPISNHLPLYTYCFQNLFQFLDRPSSSVLSVNPTLFLKPTSFPKKSLPNYHSSASKKAMSSCFSFETAPNSSLHSWVLQ
ncbi:hypothetical protein CsSME_00037622 [Camellia sinensis var. sinensis]